MKTNQLNLCEALNFVFAGYKAHVIQDSSIAYICYTGEKLRLHVRKSLVQSKPSTREVCAKDFKTLMELAYNIGDDRSIKGKF